MTDRTPSTCPTCAAAGAYADETVPHCPVHGVESVVEAMARAEEDASAEGVAAGLAEARGAMAELWRRHEDPALRCRARRALHAIVYAENSMRRAGLIPVVDTVEPMGTGDAADLPWSLLNSEERQRARNARDRQREDE